MRDAFGGTFMIQIFIVFILIYISFTALALNYAKAFKAKNIIIDYLEENEIVNLDEATIYDNMIRTFEEEIFVGLNYKTTKDICEGKTDNENFHCENIGFIIEKTGDSKNTEGIYYTVSTYVGWDLGFLSPLLRLNGNNDDPTIVPGYWKISGQTRLIVNE